MEAGWIDLLAPARPNRGHRRRVGVHLGFTRPSETKRCTVAVARIKATRACYAGGRNEDTNRKTRRSKKWGDRLASGQSSSSEPGRSSRARFELDPDDPVRDHTDEIIPNLQLRRSSSQEICHPPDKDGSIADVGPLIGFCRGHAPRLTRTAPQRRQLGCSPGGRHEEEETKVGAAENEGGP